MNFSEHEVPSKNNHFHFVDLTGGSNRANLVLEGLDGGGGTALKLRGEGSGGAGNEGGNGELHGEGHPRFEVWLLSRMCE